MRGDFKKFIPFHRKVPEEKGVTKRVPLPFFGRFMNILKTKEGGLGIALVSSSSCVYTLVS